jgi:hypothetical protein
MQTIGPYRLRHTLGTCPVGGVWSATDAANNEFTVAVLNASAAHDPGWRNAFAATANSLAQSGQVTLIAGDYSGPIPWITSAARDGSVLGQVFVALGMDYRPVDSPAGPAAIPPQPPPDAAMPAFVPPQPISVPPQPVSAPPEPVSGGADPTAFIQSMPVAAQPTPVGSVPMPRQPTAEPAQQPTDLYAPPPASGSPYTVSPFSVPPAEPPRRRPGVLIGVLVLVLLVLLGGGGALAAVLWPSDGEPRPDPATQPPVAQGTTPPAAPEQPGIEPPADGEWPTNWPAFTPEEPVTPMSELAGLGFSFQVPEGWDCTDVADPRGLAHYTCGPAGGDDETGGELIVRECPDPCDAEQRVDLRTAEEAWGVQWIRDGFYRCWGETSQIGGEERYGLAIVGYWRTSEEGRLDRQLVFRMTAPVDQADEIRKVANSVREGIL